MRCFSCKRSVSSSALDQDVDLDADTCETVSAYVSALAGPAAAVCPSCLDALLEIFAHRFDSDG